MRLTQISTTGFKDQNFTRELTGLDVFTSGGENGVGKSSALEVALLVSLGYLPDGGGGNTVDSVLKYTTGDTIKVCGEFSNGSAHTIDRIFSATGKNKRLIAIDGEGLPYADGQKKAGELLGFLPMMVDITEFMGMSNNKKKEFILRFSPEGSGWTKEEFLFVCRARLLSAKMEPGVLNGIIAGIGGGKQLKELSPDEAGKLINALQNMSGDDHTGAVNDIAEKLGAGWNDTLDAQQNISRLIETQKKERTIYDRKIKENRAGAKKIGEVGHDSTEAIAGTIRETKETLTTLRADLSKVEKQGAADDEKRKGVDRRDKQIEKLRASVTVLKATGYEAGKKEIEAEIKNLGAETANDTEDLESGLEERRSRLEDYNKKHSDLTREYAVNSTHIDLKSETLSKIRRMSSKKVCAISPEITCAMDAVKIEKSLFAEIAEIKTDNGRIKEKGLLVSESIRRIIQSIIQAEEATKKMRKEQKAKTEVKSKLETTLARLDEQEKTRISNLKEQESQIGELEKEDREDPGLCDPETLAAQKKGIESQIRTKDTELSELERRKAILIAEKQLKLDQARDEIIFSIIKETIKILGPAGLQGEIMEAVKKPLEDEVNAILLELNHNMKFGIDLFGGFKMGWLKGDRLIPFQTINQAHHIIMVVAFLTAVINRINPALKLMCIEAAELGTDNMILMLEGLAKLKESGRLDNVLVAHHQTLTNDILPAGWSQQVLIK